MLDMLLYDPNVRWVVMASLLLGLSGGALGCFAFLRKQSLMGDVLAHAALPGICIAFMLVGTRSLIWFMVGAAVAGMIATFGIGYVTRHSRIKQDTALAMTLSVFFGLGVVLLTHIQHHVSGNQGGLDTFLFGQAAAMMMSDVYLLTVVTVLLLAACTLFFKEFKLISFDPEFAKGIGLPVAALEQFLMFLIVIAVVVGIQAVGVVLMAALLIIPAVTARYWTDNLAHMVIIAGFVGGFSGISGTMLSTLVNHLPTGPLIVLSATFLFAMSLILSPKRGWIGKWLSRKKARTLLVDQLRMDQIQDRSIEQERVFVRGGGG